MSDFEALRELLGTYLHQDWHCDYTTVWQAVAAFARDEPDQVPKLKSELARIIAAGKTEEELSELFDELGSDYWPPGGGLTHSDWLIELRARLD